MWKQLGTFDVRFDDARPQRGSKFSEAFFTFRNLSEEMQKVFFSGGTFRVSTTGPEGVVRDQGQLYAVRGLSPHSMNWQPWVMPGREIRLRFLLSGPLGSAITIEHSESGAKQTFTID